MGALNSSLKKQKKTPTFCLETHTCRLLDALQQVFGGDEEVQQALQCITVVTFLNGAKQLAEDNGRRGLKGWEEGREGTLDRWVQRFWVLRDKKRDWVSLGIICGIVGIPKVTKYLKKKQQKETADILKECDLFFQNKVSSVQWSPNHRSKDCGEIMRYCVSEQKNKAVRSKHSFKMRIALIFQLHEGRGINLPLFFLRKITVALAIMCLNRISSIMVKDV